MRSFTIALGFGLASLALTLCGSGCNPDSLLAHHVESDRRQVVEQRWNSVRGNMKLQVVEQHLGAGRLKEAHLALNEALAMSPTEAKAYQIAARLYLEEGEIAKARDALQLAARLPGDDAQTEYLAGIVSQRYGNLKEALEHYRAATRINGNSAEYMMAAAETLVALDQPAEALDLVAPRLDDFDGNIALKMLAARICRLMGLRGPAVTACSEARRFSKGDPSVEVEIGLILLWAEKYAEGIEVLQPLVDIAIRSADPLAPSKLDPDGPVTPTVIFALANAYLSLLQPNQAQLILKPLIANGSSDEVAWTLYARATLLTGDADSAELALTAFHHKNKPTAETLLLQAYVAFVRQKFDQAHKLAEQAYQLDSSLQPALWLMGRCAQANGDLESARQIYSRAVANDPQSLVAKAILATLAISDASLASDNADQSEKRLAPKGVQDDEVPLGLWNKSLSSDMTEQAAQLDIEEMP